MLFATKNSLKAYWWLLALLNVQLFTEQIKETLCTLRWKIFLLVWITKFNQLTCTASIRSGGFLCQTVSTRLQFYTVLILNGSIAIINDITFDWQGHVQILTITFHLSWENINVEATDFILGHKASLQKKIKCIIIYFVQDAPKKVF